MSELAGNHIDPMKNAFIHEELEIVARRIRFLDVVRALALSAAGAVLYLMAVVIADHVVEGGLPLGLRRGLLGGVGGLMAAMAISAITLPLVRRINQRYAARLIERRFPKLHNSLITTLEVQQHADANTGVVAGLVYRTARQLARRDV